MSRRTQPVLMKIERIIRTCTVLLFIDAIKPLDKATLYYKNGAKKRRKRNGRKMCEKDRRNFYYFISSRNPFNGNFFLGDSLNSAFHQFCRLNYTALSPEEYLRATEWAPDKQFRLFCSSWIAFGLFRTVLRQERDGQGKREWVGRLRKGGKKRKRDGQG